MVIPQAVGLDSGLNDLMLDIKKDALANVSFVDEESTEESDRDTAVHPYTESNLRISDRKRQMNAAFDDFASKQAQTFAKEDDKNLQDMDDSRLTARGLMAKMETENIINNPREYQMELFDRAKKENIIAVLPTGSGKTLIAVLLLQHIIDKELEDRKAGQPRRISFFLVEVATLVYQQASVLDKNLSQPIARFCGEMNPDSWGKATWNEHFNTNLAIVVTADILYNCLASGFITMQEINLLILDEAHHTKKNHVYARIMRDFYKTTNFANRPKIFGTTASPVDAKVDAIRAARDLEMMLHSKIATVKDFAALSQIVCPPEEPISRYSSLRRPYATSLCAEIATKYRNTELVFDITETCKILTAELGEWCGDRWLAMSTIGEEGEKLERKSEQHFSTDSVSRAIFDKALNEIKAARKTIEETMQQRGRVIPDISIPDLSSKVLRLLELLDDAYQVVTDTRCIIFVERRATARLLLEVIKYHGSMHIKPGLLIGTRQGESGDQKISIREQISILRKFKAGELNVLFATSVAEEGLDIPLCNLVIRFDLYKTMIQYMQSRGRARHKESKYIHMLEENNMNHILALKDVQQQERVMRAFCQNQPPDRLLEELDADLDIELLKYGVGDKYTEQSTGAKLLFGTVLSQLAYFAACIPRTEESFPHVDYILSARGKKYVCEALLPTGSPLRSMIGKEYPRKSLAKRSAAFEACLELRKRGLLDTNLLPIYHKQLPFMRNACLALHSKQGNAYDLLIKPKFWEQGWGVVPKKLFVLLIRAENPEVLEHSIAPMVMLTRQPLPNIPSFPIYPRPGVRLRMSLTIMKGSINVSNNELQSLNTFTLRIYKDAFNKVYEDNMAQMSYWLAPLQDTASDCDGAHPELIDWAAVEFVQKNERIPWTNETEPEQLENRFFVDEYNGGHRYYSLRVDPTLKATDPPPAGVVKKDFMDSIINWTSSLWKKSRDKVSYDLEQPVFSAYKVPLRRNWLDDWNDDDLAERTKAWICPQPLKVSAIPLPNVVMSYIIPALIWRIDAFLVAVEACSMLDLPVFPVLALEAMTKDSDNTDEARDQQIQLQRGMGKNYERLEFIGDAFLKMATSISLYAGNAGDDEFHSHVKRMLMICNKNLFGHAIDKKLYQYIRTEGFNRRSWYPEGLILKEGKGANAKKVMATKMDTNLIKHPLRSHHLNDKTIADVCEAMIGASLLTGREAGSMDLAVKAVTVMVKDDNHKALCWADYYKQYRLPIYQTAEVAAAYLDVAERVEQVTGYRFKYPRLLISAFTHPSYPFTFGHIPCYQRLEFLGDALLDMACVNFLFYRYPDKDPQWLTEHKMAMVSNKFLGTLCVKLKFYKHLRKNSSALMHDIPRYVDCIEEAESESNGATDYWTNSNDPPKCLPDIVEAYIGAIFVDSCFDYAMVENFFEKHIRWFFEDMSVYDTFANNHPTTFLGNLLTNAFHCNHYAVQAREMPAGHDGTIRITAGVMIHFRFIAQDQSSSSKYAKVRASKKAIKLLEEMTLQQFKEKFGCDCQVGYEGGSGTENGIAEQAVGTAI